MEKESQKELSQLKRILKELEYRDLQTRILEAITVTAKTAREISNQTGIRRPHVHTNLKKLLSDGIIKEMKSRPNRYSLSFDGLVKKLDEKRRDLRQELYRLEKFDTKSLRLSLQTQISGEDMEAVESPPMFLRDSKEFHDTAANILNKSTDVIIGTNWPFPWIERFQIDRRPNASIEKYWEKHIRFLEKTREGPETNRLTYLVNIARYIELLDNGDSSEKIGAIRAIISCVKLIKDGCHVDFMNIAKVKQKPSLTTFIVGRDSGLFAISMSSIKHIIMYGLSFQHSMLAEIYGRYVDMFKERAIAYGEGPERRLKKIIETVLSEVDLPRKDKRKLEQELNQVDNSHTVN